ncbi:hypothetical protein DFJ58DRAFT_821491 [Suillus subalutaceus]|uniref:uncharacterized protein n=1 Tax=Suillus subalutaceus TaxID=48586 RepID=UPI001B865D0D|nr:uncharacterized protein DFJ58DRAFT_821491 [Suillus subalutaceus]KAG1834328.1 hypothetical protein DFJ58DRAFT_821491 [Suillus subalutaceus]
MTTALNSQPLQCLPHWRLPLSSALARQLAVSTTCHRLKLVVFPSAAIRESDNHLAFVQQGDNLTKEIEKEIDFCKAMIPGKVEAYLQKVSQSQSLRAHLKTLEKDVEDITFLSRTQAVADRTGYRGFADWAEKTSRTHEHLLLTLGQVAFVGAGLTYGAIFGSSRGNIGLMCYAFALFDCGFIVPTVALALLKWASQQPKDAVFASPQVWTLLLNIFLYGSAAAIGAAICLLNISLLVLHFSVGQNGQLTDAKLQFNVEPTPAGTLALGCFGLAVVVVVVSGLAYYLANGWDAMIKDLFGRRECCKEGLQDYVPV